MKISAIVSSHNKAWALERCIRSVADQVPPPCEVIVTEDCSSDGSPAIIRRLMEEIPLIRLVTYPEKSTDWIRDELIVAKECVGDYIHRIGADDYLFPGFYEAALAGNGAGVILANVRVITIAGETRVPDSSYSLPPGFHCRTPALRKWLCEPPLPGGTPVLGSREVTDWFRETRMELTGTWMDSVGYPAAMWPFGVYFIPQVYGVWTEDPESFGGSNRPQERRDAGKRGCAAWLADPRVRDKVPRDVREAMMRAVNESR